MVLPIAQYIKCRIYAFVLALLFVVCFLGSFGQINNLPNRISFAQYLASNKQFKEANYVLKSINSSNFSIEQLDSLHFITGCILEEQDSLQASTEMFAKVSESSLFYPTSVFALVVNNWKLKDHTSHLQTLNQLLASKQNDSIKGITTLVLAANYLLQDSLQLYQKCHQFLLKNNNAVLYQDAVAQLQSLAINRKFHEKKSPVLAAMFSAVLPGAGKWYAGKIGPAFGALLPVSTLALLSNELYQKNGVKSVGFIGIASLLSVFYVGNIWGSYAAAKIKNQELRSEYENKIIATVYAIVVGKIHNNSTNY